ncbi:HD family phosphohydrolase [Youngiibacter fragilis]|uniref:Phosphohydrolase n=1 Tax=Youngiibacter fragilis 232.1 TaxID=994573 RepID=V7I4G0_9CLOT|nr:HDIG domain-containing metalloprotein [Youngiibacter fragilis]ETA80176.1 phosphohydrolase [Youngiibacter fragilis 232.1]
MNDLNRKDVIWMILAAFAAAAISFGIISTTLVSKKYELEVGDISPVDFKAAYDTVDKVTTGALTEDARDSIQDQYSEDVEVRRSLQKAINDFFNSVISEKAYFATDEERAESLVSKTASGITADEFLALLSLSNEVLRSMVTDISESVSLVYSSVIEEDDQGELEKATVSLRSSVEATAKSDAAASAIWKVMQPFVKPNYLFDEALTAELKADAAAKVKPVVIKANQTIVKEGEPVREYQLALLDDFGYLASDKSDFLPFVGIGIGVIAVYGIILFYLNKYYRDLVTNRKSAMLIFAILLLSTAISRAMIIISPYALPYTFSPMLLMILTKKRIGQTMSILNSILISMMTGFDPQVIVLMMLTSVISIILLKRVEERNDIVKSSTLVGLMAFVVSFGMGLLVSGSSREIIISGAIAGAACIVSGVLVIGVLPILENLFNIVTEIKLLELSNPNNPLLKRLQMEAPGTYQHSIMVGNLAEAAGEIVGANTILLRVGAYYHDIGKLSRPKFFKENQIGCGNPHNEITPNLSTLIITSHVKVGLEMAEKAKLPLELREMITQHHGTTLVKYFFVTQKNISDKPEEVSEDDFRYPGPKPKSKEAGIMMLADSVEASVRSLQEPTEGKVQAMVYKVIRDKQDDGQLDECDLTYREVSLIRNSFLKTLSSMYHERIEYPEDKRKKLQDRQVQV